MGRGEKESRVFYLIMKLKKQYMERMKKYEGMNEDGKIRENSFLGLYLESVER